MGERKLRCGLGLAAPPREASKYGWIVDQVLREPGRTVYRGVSELFCFCFLAGKRLVLLIFTGEFLGLLPVMNPERGMSFFEYPLARNGGASLVTFVIEAEFLHSVE